MSSSTLYPHLQQKARFFVLFVLFNVCCIASQKKQKNVNMIQGNVLITKHILNVITNVLACELTLYLPTMANTMFALKIII